MTSLKFFGSQFSEWWISVGWWMSFFCLIQYINTPNLSCVRHKIIWRFPQIYFGILTKIARLYRRLSFCYSLHHPWLEDSHHPRTQLCLPARHVKMQPLTPPKINRSPLKNDGSKETVISFWDRSRFDFFRRGPALEPTPIQKRLALHQETHDSFPLKVLVVPS